MQTKASIRSRMSVILIIIVSLSITCAEYHEQKLISELNNFFNFDHNIYLFDSSAHIDRFINTRGSGNFTPQSLYVFKSADDNITDWDSLQQTMSKNTFVIVVPRSVNFELNLYVLTRLKEVQRLQINLKIGIFFPHIASSEDLQDLFKWSWKQQIINIFAATHSHSEELIPEPEASLNIFTYNPFGTFDVINVTGSEAYDKYFLSQYSNFQQYPLRRVPSLLLRFDALDDAFWGIVFGALNASSAVYNVTAENEIYVCPRQDFADDNKRNSLYPWQMLKKVILVPEALPYSGFVAYFQVLTTYSLLVYTFITITVIIGFLIFFRFKRQRKYFLVESAADVLNLLMNDNAHIKYQQLSDIEVLLIVPLTFAGLIIVNAVLSALLSFFTQPLLQPQIDTIEDIYRSPFLIYTDSEIWTNITIDVLASLSEHRNWADKMSKDYGTSNTSPVWSAMLAINTSRCFVHNIDTGYMMFRVQKRLQIKGFRISQVHIYSVHSAYSLSKDFPFIERLNEITHRIRSSGLFDIMIKKVYAFGENLLVEANALNESLKEETNESQDYEMVTFIVCSWIASITVFVIELMWKRFLRNRRLHNFCQKAFR